MNTDHASMQRLREYLMREGLKASPHPTSGPVYGQLLVEFPHNGAVVGVRIEKLTGQAVLFDPRTSNMVKITEIVRWPVTDTVWTRNMARCVREWLEQHAHTLVGPATPAVVDDPARAPGRKFGRGYKPSMNDVRAILRVMHTARSMQDALRQLGVAPSVAPTVMRYVIGVAHDGSPRAPELDPERRAMLKARTLAGLPDVTATHRLRSRLTPASE